MHTFATALRSMSPGLHIICSRAELTGEERANSPLRWADAMTVAADQLVLPGMRILALHRLLDLLEKKRGRKNYSARWFEIAQVMCEMEELPYRLRLRLYNGTSRSPLENTRQLLHWASTIPVHPGLSAVA